MRELILGNDMKKREDTIEDIKTKALDLIGRYVGGASICSEAGELWEAYVCMASKYKRGDMVFYFDRDLRVVEAEVMSVQKDGPFFWYNLSEQTGRNCGRWREELLFASRQELKENLERVISRI